MNKKDSLGERMKAYEAVPKNFFNEANSSNYQT